MFYVVNNNLNSLYVLSNKTIGPGKKSKINKRREARVLTQDNMSVKDEAKFDFT